MAAAAVLWFGPPSRSCLRLAAQRDFVEYQSSITGDLSGNKLSQAPEWTVSSAVDYRLPLRRAGSISARIEYNHRSSLFFSNENDPNLAQPQFRAAIDLPEF